MCRQHVNIAGEHNLCKSYSVVNLLDKTQEKPFYVMVRQTAIPYWRRGKSCSADTTIHQGLTKVMTLRDGIAIVIANEWLAILM